MSLITVGTGAPDVEPGTYPVTCIGIEPKVVPYNGEDNDVFEWKFGIDGSDDGEGNPIEVSGLTSQMTGPKSKTAAFLNALLGPEALVPGAGFDAPDLVGKQALASIVLNAKGWPKVDGLLPLPKGTAPRRAAPAAPTVSPLRAGATVQQQAAAGEDDLPF